MTRALALLALVSANAALWHEIDQQGTLPPVRGEMSAVRAGRRLVMHGGCDIEFAKYFNDTWAFDLDKYTWSRLATTGTAPAACGHGAALAGDSMLIFGGLVAGAAVGADSDALHVLDLRTLRWSRRTRVTAASAPEPWPPRRALIQHSMVALGCRPSTSTRTRTSTSLQSASALCAVAVVAGTSSSAGDDESAWAYEWEETGSVLTSGRWRRLSAGQAGQLNVGGASAIVVPGSTPRGSSSSSSSSSSSALFVLGGFRTDLEAPNSTLADFDTLALGSRGPQQRFKPVALPPAPGAGTALAPRLAFHAAVWHDGCVVVAGGFNPSTVSGDVWVFSVASSRWRRLDLHGSVPPPHFAQGVVYDADTASLVAYGGRIHPTGHDEELATDMWRLDLNTTHCR